MCIRDRNNGYPVLNGTSEQALGFGVATWYMLHAGTNTNSNRLRTNANTATPFMAFVSSPAADDAQLAAQLSNLDFQRKMTTVKRSSEMVMVVESASYNWSYAVGTPGSTTYTTAAANKNLVPRLGARHGSKTADGRDALTNIAFFDGHVAGYPTQPFSTNGIMTLNKDTIFFVGMAK